jgi:predicted ABC-class ATPase
MISNFFNNLPHYEGTTATSSNQTSESTLEVDYEENFEETV